MPGSGERHPLAELRERVALNEHIIFGEDRWVPRDWIACRGRAMARQFTIPANFDDPFPEELLSAS